MLNILLYQNINYTITQSFSPLPREDGRKLINTQRKRLIATEDDGLSQIEAITEALDNLASGDICFGKYHFSIIIFGDSIKEVEDNTNIVIRELNDLGLGVCVADIALPATYFSQLPCNFSIRPRCVLISSANFSSLITLHNFPVGKRSNNCWGDATTIIKTPNGQPYYLNFHQTTRGNDFGEKLLGNTLIIGQ